MVTLFVRDKPFFKFHRKHTRGVQHKASSTNISPIKGWLKFLTKIFISSTYTTFALISMLRIIAILRNNFFYLKSATHWYLETFHPFIFHVNIVCTGVFLPLKNCTCHPIGSNLLQQLFLLPIPTPATQFPICFLSGCLQFSLLLLSEFKWIKFYCPWYHQKASIFFIISGEIEVN